MSWRDYVKRTVPYTPGEQPKRRDIIKLNTNENPYPPSTMVMEALKSLDSDGLRRYPDPDVGALSSALADYYGVDYSQVFVGVGSDDVLAMAYMTFFNSDKPLLFPDISYSFYDVWAELFGVLYKTIPLREDFTICPDDYSVPNGGIIFPNPNAPTGILMGLQDVENILGANRDSVVIVDEAYIDFGGESALSLLDKYDNLLVVRTFSKSRSMAGMRIGFAIGSSELISFMKQVKFSFNSYTMNRAAIEAGCASLRDEAYYRDCLCKIINTRDETVRQLDSMGFQVLPSCANFVFAKPPMGGDNFVSSVDNVEDTALSAKTEAIFDALKDAGIYVRYFKKPRISNYLRITIGTDDEMKAFISKLREILERI